MNGGQIEAVSRAFDELKSEVEEFKTALSECAAALEEVRSDAINDTPWMRRRVDQAIEKARKLV